MGGVIGGSKEPPTRQYQPDIEPDIEPDCEPDINRWLEKEYPVQLRIHDIENYLAPNPSSGKKSKTNLTLG